MGPRWLLGLCLLAAPVGATVPTTHYCGQQLCVALADHPDLVFKDTYVHTAKDGVEHRVIRYLDGTSLSVLMSPAQGSACKRSEIRVEEQVSGNLTGLGCAAGRHGMPDKRLYVVVRAGDTDPLRFLSRTGPLIWIQGRDESGTYHEDASTIVSVHRGP